MIDPEIQKIVQSRILDIQKEHDVEILLAVESGSRAWGFPSMDSDYDVRFIYRHRLEWYLKVLPERDVIEYPIVGIMDYSGWDLKKSLFLLNKSNPVLFEWFQSPLVYFEKAGFREAFAPALSAYLSPPAMIYHYLHMADRNYREYLKRDYVKVKKYFYVLRPIFACQWVHRFSSAPPMDFEELKNAVLENQELNGVISDLLIRKRSGGELGEEPKIELINDFVEHALFSLHTTAKDFDPEKKSDSQLLNALFISIVLK